jgi:hypothetical protein
MTGRTKDVKCSADIVRQSRRGRGGEAGTDAAKRASGKRLRAIHRRRGDFDHRHIRAVASFAVGSKGSGRLARVATCLYDFNTPDRAPRRATRHRRQHRARRRLLLRHLARRPRRQDASARVTAVRPELNEPLGAPPNGYRRRARRPRFAAGAGGPPARARPAATYDAAREPGCARARVPYSAPRRTPLASLGETFGAPSLSPGSGQASRAHTPSAVRRCRGA